MSDSIKGFTEIEGDYKNNIYGCSARKLEIVWRRNTSAAVVEQVGRNAYWSENINAGGGVSSAGYMKVDQKAKINLYGKSGQPAEVNVWSTRQ